MIKKKEPIILAILDGWGIGPQDNTNAIHLANTATFDYLCEKYPSTRLGATGTEVGLDNHQTSGSETGHMNIGAGRIIKQDSRKISESINTGTFFHNAAFLGALAHIKKNKSNLHLAGLLGNEDSPHMNPYHLEALLLLAKRNSIKNVFIHFFSDGRDSFPKSALEHLASWNKTIKQIGVGEIASIVGRFYAMDRAKNWGRLKIAYDLLVSGRGNKFDKTSDAVKYSYEKNLTDEYLKPSLIKTKKGKFVTINNNDSVIFFNLRSDRARQFAKLFVLEKSKETKLPQPRLKNLYFVAMTNFGPDLPVHTAFQEHPLNGTLPIALSKFRQLYIAETEKFAHITYFLNGGYADAIDGEDRLMVPSPKTDSYAKIPQMAAEKITQNILGYLKKEKYNFVAVNFANADMVGHTGEMKATIRAVEVVDMCLGKIYKEIKKSDGLMLVTADHGNADCMWDKKANLPMTFHTKNPVPLIVCDKRFIGKKIKNDGVLGNVAPTLCKIMGVEKLKEMKRNSLI